MGDGAKSLRLYARVVVDVRLLDEVDSEPDKAPETLEATANLLFGHAMPTVFDSILDTGNRKVCRHQQYVQGDEVSGSDSHLDQLQLRWMREDCFSGKRVPLGNQSGSLLGRQFGRLVGMHVGSIGPTSSSDFVSVDEREARNRIENLVVERALS